MRPRFYSVNAGGQQIVPMTLAAADVPCYQAGPRGADVRLLAADAARTIADQPDNLWYRFIVTDGTDTDYYADDTAALDGGLGARDRRPRRQQLGADAVTCPASPPRRGRRTP